MIPVIKDNIIMRDESQGAVIVDTDNDKYELISPIEAFIFSLFDGTKTIYDIIKYIKVLKNAPDEKEILNDVYEFLKSKSNYVELIERPLKKVKSNIIHLIFYIKMIHYLNVPKDQRNLFI